MGTVCYYTVPLLLQPGVETNGTRFSGTTMQSLIVLGVFGLVLTFGITTLCYGLWQIKTGKRNIRVAYFMVGLFSFFVITAFTLKKLGF